MTQEALTLALDAFEQIFESTPPYRDDGTCVINDKSVELSNKAIAAIKEALAQTQEPVATFDEVWDSIDWDKWRMEPIRELVKMIHSKTTPPRRTWVGLTDKERSELVTLHHGWNEYGQAIESKLKEVNT